MRSASAHGALLLALALASCRDDSTGAPTQPVPPGLLASRHEADDPLQFSDWSAPVNLGPPVNTAFIDQGAAISRDGLSLYLHCGNCPGNIGGAVNTTVDDITPDPFEADATGGDALYFARGPIASGGTDIYASPLLTDGTYGPGAAVAELNTASIERQPAIRRDGLEIFFASDRDGPPGNPDLFAATRPTSSDHWSTPVNLGPTVNTSLIEARPALSADGTTLYFQSTRPGAVGCTSATGPCVFDIWVTTRTRLDAQDDDRGHRGRPHHDRHEH